MQRREGWPEGAIDYVASMWGMNELDLERDSYRRIDGDQVTDEYIMNRVLGIDPSMSGDSPWSRDSGTSGSWMSYDPYDNYQEALWPYEFTDY